MQTSLVLDPGAPGRFVVGLDLSLTCTGVAAIDVSTGELITAVHRSPSPTADSLAAHAQRHRDLAHGIAAQVIACDPVLAVVEGLKFSVSEKDSSLARRGYLWWAVVDELCAAGVPVLEAAPSQIKKLATGNGAAGKNEMVIAYATYWPYAPRDRWVADRADATFAGSVGAAWLGDVPLPFPVTAKRRTALAKLPAPSAPPRTGSTVGVA